MPASQVSSGDRLPRRYRNPFPGMPRRKLAGSEHMRNEMTWFERAIGERAKNAWQGCAAGADTAVFQVPADRVLATSIDTLVCGVHFTMEATPAEIGHKALAVNLSDLAAMGANPSAALISLSATGIDSKWLNAFGHGLWSLADRFHVQLLGGTLCDGPLAITISVYGNLPAPHALRRGNASVGDLIFVTGTLGDAGLALAMACRKVPAIASDRYRQFLETRLNRPEPRIIAGIALRNLASSAIDLSDGLLADLNHVLTASHVGATIDVTRLPLSEAMKNSIPLHEARRLALTAGDDYELCFTVPSDKLTQLESVRAHFDCPIQCIGKIEGERGVRCFDEQGSWPGTPLGYQHFA